MSTAPGNPAPRSHNLKIAFYAGVVFLYWMSLYLYVPTLPVYAQTKTQDLALVGTMLSMYGLWQMIIRLPVGIFSDWVGRRKPFIVVGLSLSALGAYWMGRAAGIQGMIVGRATTGLAAGTWVPLVVVFSGLFPPAEAVRATALLNIISSTSRLVSTTSTGFLNELGGYRLAYNLSAGVAVLAILAALLAPEKRLSGPTLSPRSIGSLITRRDVLLPSLLSAVTQYASWASAFGFIPVLAKQFGASDLVEGLLMSLNIAILIPGSLITNRLSGRIGARRLVYLSFAVLAGGIWIVAAANSLVWLVLSQIVTGLALGAVQPLLMGMSIERVQGPERATAMGVHQSVYAIGMTAGPWLGGILADAIGLQPMFAVTGVICLVLGVLGASLLPKPK